MLTHSAKPEDILGDRGLMGKGWSSICEALGLLYSTGPEMKEEGGWERGEGRAKDNWEGAANRQRGPSAEEEASVSFLQALVEMSPDSTPAFRYGRQVRLLKPPRLNFLNQLQPLKPQQSGLSAAAGERG